MSEAAHHKAIRQGDSGRDDLLMFEVVSKIHRTDIESMAHAVDTAMDAHEQIDILLVFTDFEGASLGALLDGQAMGVSLRSNAHVRRYAVVGAPAWAKAMIELFDPISPVEARKFDLDQLDQARAWVGDALDAGTGDVRPGSLLPPVL